jgi:adenine-specific DNA-methyltransferase
MIRLQNEKRLYWGVNGTSKTPMRKLFKFEAKQGMTTPTIWDDVALNQHASAEIEKIFGEKAAFETPKPEALVQRILHIATNSDDLILDSFLGSGTAVAVAHKMGRRWIGIELGDHAISHCVPRLRKVVDGEQGGISATVGWQGGGGFRFYRLGEPVFDELGCLHLSVKFDVLAAHIWFSETGSPLSTPASMTPLLGIHRETAVYLLYNGILGDKRPQGGNVLTTGLLRTLPAHNGPKVIYGEVCTLSDIRLRAERITFKQLPYDLQVR